MNENLRDIRRRVMKQTPGRIHHESGTYAGHDMRLSDHARRISASPCECGSGETYGDCCMSEDRQSSLPGIHYALPTTLVPGTANRHAVEDAFRLKAFHTFHRGLGAIDDPVIRFVRALLASAKPVAHADVLIWNSEFGRHDVAGAEGQ